MITAYVGDDTSSRLDSETNEVISERS